MNDIPAGAREILIADETLLAFLAKNVNPYNKASEATQARSIVSYLKADEMHPPFITLRGDTETLVGQTHLTNAYLLVRCYNERDKTFYTINEVLSRVKKLLNGQRFTIAGYATVETQWESTGPELPDDGVGLNFREAAFRVQLI